MYAFVKKKPKPIMPTTYPQNDDGASLHIAKPTTSYMYWTLYTILPSTLLWSDQSLSDLSNQPLLRSSILFKSDPVLLQHKKSDEKPVGEFSW